MMAAKTQTLQAVSFTYCKTFAQAETKHATWDSFAATVSKSVPYTSKEESIRRAAIVGGVRTDEARGRADNVERRTILTLDYDDFDGVSLSDIELALELNMPDCAWVAYSTFRHTPEAPRVRIMAPLSREVTKAEYRAIVDNVVNALDIGLADKCSKVIAQIMFMASHRVGVEPWAEQGGAGVLDVDALGLLITADDEPAEVGGVFDLDLAVASQPLDLSPAEVATLLENYPAAPLDYDDWYRVGMALHHQHAGSDEGFELWDAWCALDGARYRPRELPKKWRSFGGSTSPVTMASVIKAAGGVRGGAVAVSAGSPVAQTLEDEAASISDMKEYASFKKRIQAMSVMQMPPDIRSMLASVVHEVFGKSAGMGLREIKTSFRPAKLSGGASADGSAEKVDAPAWLEGWVYEEHDCLFINSRVSDYAIRREAFRAKYDREPVCSDFETDAATFALNFAMIPTVAQTMYWPGMDRFFSSAGKDYLNSYFPSGIQPLPEGALDADADGQAVVQLFLDHLALIIKDPREQGIFLDWLSYVYQNPGKRVKWAMLIWGIEGNGKSYFFKIMQLLMGRNSREISTSMIERPFTDWAVGTVLACVEEIRISGINKWAILDKIKPMLTNDTLAIEPKGGRSFSAPNFASYLMLTNHQDAIPVSNNDRRYCVIFTRQNTEADLFEDLGGKDKVGQYFSTLFSESERRADAIGRWLLDRKQDALFDPSGRAPLTGGLANMREANVSDDQAIVRDAMSDHACAIVGPDILDITYLNTCVEDDASSRDMLPTNRTLATILRGLGMTPVGPRYYKINGVKHYVWVNSRKVSDEQAKDAVRNFHQGVGEFADVPF